MSDECKDFITQCLKKDPAQRLGTDGDIKQILGHPWFSDLNVDDILAKKVKAEFIPSLSADFFDTSQFDEEFTNMEAKVSMTTLLPNQLR